MDQDRAAPSAPASIAEAMASRAGNNFDLLRIFAALVVLLSHSYPLSGKGQEIFSRLLGYDTGGGYGVAIFFVISGFLVTRSVQQRSILSYLASRAARIVPALFVALAVQALVIGPLLTSLPLGAYLRAGDTWGFLHGTGIFYLHDNLPGLFTHLPVPAVNGSLWTIPVEVFYYLLLVVLATLGLLRRIPVLVLLAAASAALGYMTIFLGLDWLHQGGMMVRNVPLLPSARMGIFFLFGAACWVWRARVPLDPGLALVAAILLVIGQTGGLGGVIYYPCFGYLVLFVALWRRIPQGLYARIGDISYGTYLYAFPVQQAVLTLAGGHLRPTMLSLLAVPPTLLLGFLSWRLIEAPSLAWRRRGTH